jgi:streptomycin 6-kinase
VILHQQLVLNCQKTSVRKAWLANLSLLVRELTDRWSLRLDQPFNNSGTCSWVAPVVRSNGIEAVLKLAMPHMEGEDEISGLRFWNGRAMVRLLEADDQLGAMLLERCLPGTALRSEPEPLQDEIVASLLKRICQSIEPSNGSLRFRPLSQMIEFWRNETILQKDSWPDAGLVKEGLRVLEQLARPSSTDVLLATDLHAANVLRSQREPWLAIDPKPFVGDRSYDPVQHLLNCETRLHRDPVGLVQRFAGLCEVDPERLKLWTFARAAADPRDNWGNTRWSEIARALAH